MTSSFPASFSNIFTVINMPMFHSAFEQKGRSIPGTLSEHESQPQLLLRNAI